MPIKEGLFENVIIDTLRILEMNIIQNQNKVSELLALFNQEPYSKDGINHINVLKNGE